MEKCVTLKLSSVESIKKQDNRKRGRKDLSIKKKYLDFKLSGVDKIKYNEPCGSVDNIL